MKPESNLCTLDLDLATCKSVWDLARCRAAAELSRHFLLSRQSIMAPRQESKIGKTAAQSWARSDSWRKKIEAGVSLELEKVLLCLFSDRWTPWTFWAEQRVFWLAMAAQRPAGGFQNTFVPLAQQHELEEQQENPPEEDSSTSDRVWARINAGLVSKHDQNVQPEWRCFPPDNSGCGASKPCAACWAGWKVAVFASGVSRAVWQTMVEISKNVLIRKAARCAVSFARYRSKLFSAGPTTIFHITRKFPPAGN